MSKEFKKKKKDCIATVAPKQHMKYFATSSTQNIESKNVFYGRKHKKFCKDPETVPPGEKPSTEVAVLLLVCSEVCFTLDKVQLRSEAEINKSNPFNVYTDGFPIREE